ncbi:MAG: hypothetical protein QXK06_05390 [Candidatus Diapherotrites archaeon]
MEVQKKPMPAGMIIILVLELLSILVLVGSLSGPLQIGPVVLTGLAAIFFGFFQIIVNGTVCFSIIKRPKWGWKFILGAYAFFIFIGIVSFLFFAFDKNTQDTFFNLLASELEAQNLDTSLSNEFFSIMFPFLLAALVFGIIVNIIIAVYVFKKKDFFEN